MDLSIGGIARQVTAPVLEAAALARTAGTDRIAAFLRDNPDQRGTIETALAASGRIGDLSAIVERAGATVTGTATALTGGGSPVDGLVQRAGSVATAVATRLDGAATAVATSATNLSAPLASTAPTAAQAAADLLGRAVPTGTAPATAPTRFAAGVARGAIDARPVMDVRSPLATSAETARTARDSIGAALREGRLAELIGAATRDGRLTDLLAAARGGGQLPALVAAARPLDGALAALASSRGGLSATELALFARAGLLSPADLKALHAAGIAVGREVEEPAQGLIAPRDGLAAERFRTDEAALDPVVAAGLADLALAAFDAGAIRITSRTAVETYGVLGPPGGAVIAADAFEGLLRAAGGDRAAVERALALPAGLLSDPDTLLALVERPALAALRLADGDAAAGLPDAEPAGGVPAGLADFARDTPFRELTLAEPRR